MKELDIKKAQFYWVLIVFFILIAAARFSMICRSLGAESRMDKALRLLEKSRVLSNDLVVEKTVLYQKALGLLKESTRLDPLDARGHFEYAEAIAFAADDISIGAMLELQALGESYSGGQYGLYELAKNKYLDAISREPSNAIYHQRLGRIYARLEDTQNAEDEFYKAAALSPQNLSIQLYLAQYFLSKDKNEEFLRHIRRSIELQRYDSGGQVGGKTIEFLRSIHREDLANQL